MKKLSEVCKIVGVTRRTLQEYDKIGLLHPTGKTAAGYWLYDDDAIETLKSIVVLVECGYSRKKIKEIFESMQDGVEPDNDAIVKIFEEALPILEERKKRVENMINTAKGMIMTIKLTENLPLSSSKWAEKFSLENPIDGKNFLSQLEYDMETFGELDAKGMLNHFDLIIAIISLGFCKGMECDSPEVTKCMDVIADSLFWLEQEQGFKEIKIIDIQSSLFKIMEHLLTWDDFVQPLKPYCGEEEIKYILESAQVYEQNIKKDKEEL